MIKYELDGSSIFGPEPEIGWPEDQLSPEFEKAEAAYTEWYGERARMFWDLIVHKATDVVENHYEAISARGRGPLLPRHILRFSGGEVRREGRRG